VTPSAHGTATGAEGGPPPSATPPPGATVDRWEEPLARHLALRATTQTAERWVEVSDETALVALIRAARAAGTPVRVLPPFCDALPPESGMTGVVVRLGSGFETIEACPDGLRVGASVPLARLATRTGFQTLRGAPGVVADAIDEGWLAPAVVRTRRFRSRGIEEVDGAPPFDAKAIVTGAVLAPPAGTLALPRAGQALLPPKRRDLGAVLARLGLAGLRLGDAMLAEDDPRVLVNRGTATPRQLRLLLQAVRERIHVATGLEVQERLVPPGRGGKV
jgi:UDP-N-acetylenolpyruvoylglucosamine reductase